MTSSAAKRLYSISLVIAVAILLLALSMIAPILSTTEDFSIYNSGWNGTSDIAVSTYRSGKLVPTLHVEATDSDLNIVNVEISSLGLDPSKSSLVIIGPSTAFSASDKKSVGDFVKDGGVLLLADDFGTGNELLAGINASSRFSGDLLMDLAYNKQPEFSICFNLSKSSSITSNVTTILLNFPSSITTGKNTTVLARSSVASFLDTNGDRLRNWSEPRGPFALIAIERLGAGQIVLVSDPSILINGMRKHAGNEQLSENLLTYVSQGRDFIYFDESHRKYVNPISMTLAFLGETNDFVKLGIVIFIAFVLLTMLTEYPRRAGRATWKAMIAIWSAITRAIFRKRKAEEQSPMGEDEVVAAVLEKHPDWREGRLRMLLEQAEHHGKRTRGW